MSHMERTEGQRKRNTLGMYKVMRNKPGIRSGILATVQCKNGLLPIWWVISPHRKPKDRTWGPQRQVPLGSYTRELFDDTFKKWGRTYEQATAERTAAKRAQVYKTIQRKTNVVEEGTRIRIERGV